MLCKCSKMLLPLSGINRYTYAIIPTEHTIDIAIDYSIWHIICKRTYCRSCVIANTF